MNQFDFPIFVRAKDCGDVRRYESVMDMQQHLEQIDVEHEEYEAWDAKGGPLVLSVQALSPKVPLLRRELMFRARSPVIWLRLDRLEAGKQGELADAIADFARHNQVALGTLALNQADFTYALETITAELDARIKAMSWWQRFRRRF
jgi:hypothetical protein